LLVGASLATISTSLIAQTSEAAPDQQQAASQDASIADIVVTARRRDEALTDVPVSVPAISGRASSTHYQLRGISTAEAPVTQNPVAGIYVDDVYRARYRYQSVALRIHNCLPGNPGDGAP